MPPGEHRFKNRVFIGTNRASAYIGGRVYTLRYDRYVHGMYSRVEPAQARLVHWDDVWNVVCIQRNKRTRKPALIRVELTHIYRLQRYGVEWLTGTFYLRPSTRKEKLRPILTRMRSEQRWIPFLMGTHGRLGDHSLVGALDSDLARLVCRFA